ncbi:hypothetical protein TNCV_4006671 [Trichonephila clavipes]|nr:hypothetical protein TNCV_4006671 [Trichonephila clavipes]
MITNQPFVLRTEECYKADSLPEQQTCRVRRDDLESHRNTESEMPWFRAMVQKSREKQQILQQLNGTENI